MCQARFAHRCILSAAIAMLLGSEVFADPIEYSVTEISPLPGDTWTSPVGIDSQGNVYGYSYPQGYKTPVAPPDPGPHLIEYDASTGKTSQLSSLTFPPSLADPNARNIFDSHGNTVEVITAGNALGQTVGYEYGQPHLGFIQNADGTRQLLHPPVGLSFILPSGIDKAGDVVGDVSNSGGQGDIAFLYKNGVMYNLNDLLPAADRNLRLYLPKINAAGQIVAASNVTGEMQTFLLTPVDGQSPGTPLTVPEPATMTVLGGGLIGLALLKFRKSLAAE